VRDVVCVTVVGITVVAAAGAAVVIFGQPTQVMAMASPGPKSTEGPGCWHAHPTQLPPVTFVLLPLHPPSLDFDVKKWAVVMLPLHVATPNLYTS